jgi:hypothetical protein
LLKDKKNALEGWRDERLRRTSSVAPELILEQAELRGNDAVDAKQVEADKKKESLRRWRDERDAQRKEEEVTMHRLDFVR